MTSAAVTKRSSALPRTHPDPAQRDVDRAGGVGEEVVALVVDDDEGGEVLDLDLPDRLHAELGVLDDLDLADAVLREARRGAADRAEIEAAVLLAGLAHLFRAVALGEHHHRAALRLKGVDETVHPPRRRRAEGAGRIAGGRLRRAGIVDRMVPEMVRHRLAALEPLADLGMGDVAGDDHRAIERKARADRVPRQRAE